MIQIIHEEDVKFLLRNAMCLVFVNMLVVMQLLEGICNALNTLKEQRECIMCAFPLYLFFFFNTFIQAKAACSSQH